MQLKLHINGNDMTLPKELQTVADVIDYFQFKTPIIIVEHNDTILKRADHLNTAIASGDKLEFIQFVGGG